MVIMGIVCQDVYKKEKASSRYATAGHDMNLTKMVFNQSLWFVGAFYITWVPYLALQVSFKFITPFIGMLLLSKRSRCLDCSTCGCLALVMKFTMDSNL
jgi:hypothetical protein